VNVFNVFFQKWYLLKTLSPKSYRLAAKKTWRYCGLQNATILAVVVWPLVCVSQNELPTSPFSGFVGYWPAAVDAFEVFDALICLRSRLPPLSEVPEEL